MIWVFKGYEFNIKIARVQLLQLKMKFLVGYNLKIVILFLEGGGSCGGGGG